jgi:hydroxypyruvate isomerase
VARALKAQGYIGVVGLEAAASGDPVAAMEAFRAAFSE